MVRLLKCIIVVLATLGATLSAVVSYGFASSPPVYLTADFAKETAIFYGIVAVVLSVGAFLFAFGFMDEPPREDSDSETPE